MPLTIRKSEGGAAFAVHVVPRASKDEVVGVHGNAIKIRLTAPPVEGAANASLLKFLAKKLGVSKRQLDIVAGEASRQKLIAVTGMLPAEVEAKLLRGET